MALKFKIVFLFIIGFQISFSQEIENAAILKVILTKAYANEKVIVKNRLQLLNFYCNKAPNNEETLDVINKSELLKNNAATLKKQIDITINEDWSKEFGILFTNQHQYLKSKVNDCLSLEEFQKISAQYGENNQRLMIVSKPMHFANKYCLVKVAYYRNIEHNSGCYYLFEKKNDIWIIVETLNEWST
ncbi:hypothetical protein [Flavobacterium capsici]|uniref:Uncharacterized protein n=1 Tax=Flavobacterium capsici TaxID=3075618 RepID=A0AA96EX38_9FLAO|nr:MULTISPECIES: hypothetical protein [unclassified Flavobacterium]WNM18572.1 hypothetical protein RN608_11195 [Flavobacterium sp. PMR2A8]WNM22623.1 hypothetical protein RN605_04495 [Flavobacterium sp. PMTSA4]